MRVIRKIGFFSLLVAATLFAQNASADWLTPKWVQLPDLTIYGMDIRIDRDDQIPRVVADDFLCTESSPVTDVHFWGSWKDDIKGEITKIHLSIHSDIPASQSSTGYSMPGNLLWESDFLQGQFTERHYADISPSYERWCDPYAGVLLQNGDQNIWQYNIFIDDPFLQEGTPENPIVYWLDIYVETDGLGQFGWKTSMQHWNDDAVFWGQIPGGALGWHELIYPYDTPPWQGESVDMAFVIMPEPATFVLLGTAGLWILTRKRRSALKTKN